MHLPFYTVALVFLSLSFFLSLYFYNRSHKKSSTFTSLEKKKSLKIAYKNQKVFLCDGADAVMGSTVHFYGEPFGVSINSGMKFFDQSGMSRVVKGVYPNDSNDITLEVEADDFNWEGFNESLEKDRVVVFKFQE